MMKLIEIKYKINFFGREVDHLDIIPSNFHFTLPEAKNLASFHLGWYKQFTPSNFSKN